MLEKKCKNVLDSTFRYLYNAFRNTEVHMAIEFKHGGRIWRADTPEEAIALRRQLENGDAFDWTSEDVWTHDTTVELIRNLGEQQKVFLRLLLENGRVPSGVVRKELNLASEVALAGVLSGLSKQVKKTGVRPSDLYAVEVSWSGKEKTRTFSLAHNFRWAASEIGWPDEWEKKNGVKDLGTTVGVIKAGRRQTVKQK